MNEMPRVTTNGSWVRMMVKISAGSSGARRDQSLERRRVDRAMEAPAAPCWRPVPTATLIGPLPWCADGARVPGSRWLFGEPCLVALGDVRRELLSLIEGL